MPSHGTCHVYCMEGWSDKIWALHVVKNRHSLKTTLRRTMPYVDHVTVPYCAVLFIVLSSIFSILHAFKVSYNKHPMRPLFALHIYRILRQCRAPVLSAVAYIV